MPKARRTQPKTFELDDAFVAAVVVVVVVGCVVLVVVGCDVVVVGRARVVVVVGAVVVGAVVVVTAAVVVVAEPVVVVTDAVVVVVVGWAEALASSRPKLSGTTVQAIRMAVGLRALRSMGGSLR